MLARKDEVVKGLTDGVGVPVQEEQDHAGLRRRPKLLGGEQGRGRRPTDGEGRRWRRSTSCSRPAARPIELPFLPVRRQAHRQLDRGADLRPRCPKHLIVVGGGYIGLELGSVWRRLGAKVTVLEFLPRILPIADGEIADAGAASRSTKQGLEFHLETKVTGREGRGRRR